MHNVLKRFTEADVFNAGLFCFILDPSCLKQAVGQRVYNTDIGFKIGSLLPSMLLTSTFLCLSVCVQPNIPPAPKAPERPLQPYMRYSKENFEKVKAENQELKLQDISRILGARWKALNDKDKQVQ